MRKPNNRFQAYAVNRAAETRRSAQDRMCLPYTDETNTEPAGATLFIYQGCAIPPTRPRCCSAPPECESLP